MLNGMGFDLIVAAILGIILLYVLIRLLSYPLKLFSGLLLKAAVGIFLLVAFNLLGAWWGLSLGINPVTVLVAGLLGIPGLLMLAALQCLL